MTTTPWWNGAKWQSDDGGSSTTWSPRWYAESQLSAAVREAKEKETA